MRDIFGFLFFGIMAIALCNDANSTENSKAVIAIFEPDLKAVKPQNETPAPAIVQEVPPSYIFNISYEEAETAISKALSEKETGKKVSALISNKKSSPIYSYNKPVEVEVRGLRVDSSANRWSANLVVISEKEVISAMPLSGRFMLMSEVPMLKQAIKNGELITAENIEMKLLPQERVHADTVVNIESVIGKSPVRSISSARPIRKNEIAFPALIKKNALVQMRYKTANMEITTTGQAITEGAKGDVIEVRNTNSKAITRAVVTNENTVDVMMQGVQANAIQ